MRCQWRHEFGQHFARSAHVCVAPPLEEVVEPLDEAVWQVTAGAQVCEQVAKPFSQSWHA